MKGKLCVFGVVLLASALAGAQTTVTTSQNTVTIGLVEVTWDAEVMVDNYVCGDVIPFTVAWTTNPAGEADFNAFDLRNACFTPRSRRTPVKGEAPVVTNPGLDCGTADDCADVEFSFCSLHMAGEKNFGKGHFGLALDIDTDGDGTTETIMFGVNVHATEVSTTVCSQCPATYVDPCPNKPAPVKPIKWNPKSVGPGK